MANMPVFETRRLIQYGWDVHEGPEGYAIIAYNTMTGVRTELPFDPEARVELCRRLFPQDAETRKQLAGELLAKSVILPKHNQMPRKDH